MFYEKYIQVVLNLILINNFNIAYGTHPAYPKLL